MDSRALREALHQESFRPFEICLKDGQRIPVRHPERVAVGHCRVCVVGPDDSYSFIELPQIRSLDLISEHPVVEQHTVIRPGSVREIDHLSECFVLAIDLGFSKSKRSCGLAWKEGKLGQMQTSNSRFGECADKVYRLLESRRKAVLIVEAPLSGRFDKDGNPLEHGNFEPRNPNLARGTHRYWYSGPGAAMCLAAVFFFRGLVRRLREKPGEASLREMVLYEGFITFKPEASDHSADAQELVESFFRTPCPVAQVEVSPGDFILPILDVIGHAPAESVAPAIIIPRDNIA